MKRHVLKTCSDQESDRGCVVLDQPQHMGNGGILRLVCDTAAILSVILLLCTLACRPAHAAPQIGSAPYRASATGAGSSHSPVFSADGKHIAFVSHANNLATNDHLGPHFDLFVRDLAASNTVLVSVSTNGFGGANDNIGLYTLSSTAQVVAFDTTANNLAPSDTNRLRDIYARDLLAGTTRLVSMNADGSGSGNGPSSNPLVSEDGRYVIFESLASNLVTNDFNGTNDIFIHDLTTGLTELVSVNADGTANPDGPSHSPSVSADGLFVAFASRATNLVIGVTNLLDEIYVRDIRAASNLWAQAAHVSATHARAPVSGALEPYRASEPVLSKDGRYVAFKTLGATVRFDLHRPTNSVLLMFNNLSASPPHVAAHYFQDNPRLSASAVEASLAITANGRYLAYSAKSNLLHRSGIVLVDFESLETNVFANPPLERPPPIPFPGFTTNVAPRSRIVITNSGFNASATWTELPWLGMNTDASRIFFLADRTNSIASLTNRLVQLYGFNLPNGPVQLISGNRNGLAGPDLSEVVPSASANGTLIAWDSADDNIVADDLNRRWDVFARNVDAGETQLISARHPDLSAASGLALSRLDLNPGAISANGQRLALLSLDSTLAPDDTNNWRDLFVRDLVNGTNFDVILPNPLNPFSPTTPLGIRTAAGPFLSADGRFVAIAGETGISQGTNRTIYWRDLMASTNRMVSAWNPNYLPGPSLPVLSADGRFVAFHTADRLDPISDVGGMSDIYIYVASFTPAHHIWRNPFVVSATNTFYWPTANGHSINPIFGPDSTWIVFQSTATDLTPDPDLTPARNQLFARQFLTDKTNIAGGSLKLISYTTTASLGPNEISTDLPLPGGGANPRFSANSRYVAFESSPNLIYRHDLLNDWVVKIVTHPDPMFRSFTNRARFTNDLVCSNCFNPTLSSDGWFVAYESLPASGISRDIVVKDLQSGQTELMSISISRTNANGSSSTPLISYDARFVVFASRASDLVPGDNNRATDIFVRDRLNGITHCLSRNFAGTGTGNRVSSNPILSADGRTVAFQSFASDLVPGDYNDTRDVFVVTLGGPDTDGDDMEDDWEMAYFSTLSRDGSGDFDNDGATDREEFRAGTNPSNDASILRVLPLTTAVAQPTGKRTTVLLWSAVPGKTYRVQFKRGLDDAWTSVGADVTAASTSASQTDTVEALEEPNHPHRFYRVLLVQ